MQESKENHILKLGLNASNQILYFFGARHTNDPSDTQFDQIKQLWNEFANNSRTERAVFIESLIHEVPAEYEKAIEKYGEAGATYWLANKTGLIVTCPEPNNTEQRKALCILHKPQIVAYTFIVQNLAAWFRHTRQSLFTEAIENSVNREKQFSEIYGFIPDKSWFMDQHKKLFGEQNLDNKNFLDSITNPHINNTLVNIIVATRTKIRNYYLLEMISKAWKLKRSVFIVYGIGHLSAIENGLRELYNNDKSI